MVAEPKLEKADLLLRNAAKGCARLCPIEDAGTVKARLQDLSKRYPDWQLVTREAVGILTFRGQMYEALEVQGSGQKREDADA